MRSKFAVPFLVLGLAFCGYGCGSDSGNGGKGGQSGSSAGGKGGTTGAAGKGGAGGTACRWFCRATRTAAR